MLLALVLAVPDGWLPVPPAPGASVGPSIVGRPASARHYAVAIAQNPTWPPSALTCGPGSRAPAEVERVVEFGLGMRPAGDRHLRPPGRVRRTGRYEPAPGRPGLDAAGGGAAGPASSATCAGDVAYLDEADRAVVATTDRRVLAVRTGSSDGEAGLNIDATWDLKPYVPYGDCLVALAPDSSGGIWWASQQGLVGTIAPDSGRVRVVDLGEEVRHGLVTDE